MGENEDRIEKAPRGAGGSQRGGAASQNGPKISAPNETPRAAESASMRFLMRRPDFQARLWWTEIESAARGSTRKPCGGRERWLEAGFGDMVRVVAGAAVDVQRDHGVEGEGAKNSSNSSVSISPIFGRQKSALKIRNGRRRWSTAASARVSSSGSERCRNGGCALSPIALQRPGR